MPSEAQEKKATNKALDMIANWMRSGTNEGISFTVSRLSDDLFTESFLGGGDASQFTPSGRRGKLTSQLSNANILDSGGGVPKSFPIQFTFDLNTAKAKRQLEQSGDGTGGKRNSDPDFFQSSHCPGGKVLHVLRRQDLRQDGVRVYVPSFVSGNWARMAS